MTTISRPLPNIIRITLGDLDIQKKINIPARTGKITVKFITNSGKISFAGSDGGTVSDNYLSIVNDVFFQINWSPLSVRNTARTYFFVSGDVDATDVEILIEA